MTEVYSPWSQCRNKMRLPTKADAKRHARHVETRRANDRKRGRISVYRCPHCDYWHVGHDPKRLRQ